MGEKLKSVAVVVVGPAADAAAQEYNGREAFLYCGWFEKKAFVPQVQPLWMAL